MGTILKTVLGAPTLVDLLERFHEAHDVQPSARDLRAFARGNHIPYPSERTQKFSAALSEWKASRRQRGLPGPHVITRVGGRGHKAPDYSHDVDATRSGERRRAKWTRESCVNSVACYLAQLPRGERSTQRGYSDWAATQPTGTAPAMSTILEHGGWETVRRTAIATSIDERNAGLRRTRIRCSHVEVDTMAMVRPGAPWESWAIIIGGGVVLLGLVASLIAFARLWRRRKTRDSLQEGLTLFALIVTSLGISAGFVGSTVRESREYSGLETPELIAALVVVIGLGALVAFLHYRDRSAEDKPEEDSKR